MYHHLPLPTLRWCTIEYKNIIFDYKWSVSPLSSPCDAACIRGRKYQRERKFRGRRGKIIKTMYGFMNFQYQVMVSQRLMKKIR